MSGHPNPLACCDEECAALNNCQDGGYQCGRCGYWFCAGELDADGYCDDCAKERREEEGEEVCE